MSDKFQCASDCRERTDCLVVGGPGHFQCGTCELHEEPRHHCGCIVISKRNGEGT